MKLFFQNKSTLKLHERQKCVGNYFSRNFGTKNGKLNLDIAEECQMFRYGYPKWKTDPAVVFDYLNTANQQVYSIDKTLEATGKKLENLDSFLDFAAGFGRLTRFLIQRLPPEKVWVSDIQPSAMKFQSKTFGVHTCLSALEPNDFQPGRKFEFIFVASLFSHLPRNRFDQWLKRLWELLTPDGVLAFSVLDRGTALMRLPYNEEGFTYHPEVSEIEMLPGSEYGSTIVTERFVAESLARATDGKAQFQLIPRGMWHQDLYIVRAGDPMPNPNWGIMDSYFPLVIARQHVFGTLYGTFNREMIRSIELLIRDEVMCTVKENTWQDDATAFHCGERFLAPGWGPSLAFSIKLPRPMTYEDDLVLRATGQHGSVRVLPVSMGDSFQ